MVRSLTLGGGIDINVVLLHPLATKGTRDLKATVATAAKDQMARNETEMTTPDECRTNEAADDVANLSGFSHLPAELQLAVADFMDDDTLAKFNRISSQYRALTTPLLTQRALASARTVDFVRQAIKRNQVQMLQRLLGYDLPPDCLDRGLRESIRFLGMRMPPPKLDALRLIADMIPITTDHLCLASMAKNGTGVLEALLPNASKAEINKVSLFHYDLPLLAAAEYFPTADAMRLLLNAGADPEISCEPGRYSRHRTPGPMNVITRAFLSYLNPFEKVRLLDLYGVQCASINGLYLQAVLTSRDPQQLKERRALFQYAVEHGCPVGRDTIIDVLLSSSPDVWSPQFISRLLDAYGQHIDIDILAVMVEKTTVTNRPYRLMEIAQEMISHMSLYQVEEYWDTLTKKLSRLMVAVGDRKCIDDEQAHHSHATQNRLDLAMLKFWKQLETLAILLEREDELWWWSGKTLDPQWLAYHKLRRLRA